MSDEKTPKAPREPEVTSPGPLAPAPSETKTRAPKAPKQYYVLHRGQLRDCSLTVGVSGRSVKIEKNGLVCGLSKDEHDHLCSLGPAWTSVDPAKLAAAAKKKKG